MPINPRPSDSDQTNFSSRRACGIAIISGNTLPPYIALSTAEDGFERLLWVDSSGALVISDREQYLAGLGSAVGSQ